MRIDLACEACGTNRFQFPKDGGDEAMIVCADCGRAVGTLGSLKAKVERAVLRNTAGKTGAAKRSG